MDILSVIITSTVSILVLFILTKLIGNHQMSQVNMFDYIVGISIGSIAAEMATELEEYRKPLTAMIIYALISVLSAYLSRKSLKARRFLNGKTILLYNNGKLFHKNLRSAKMDLSEMLTECRNQGYFNLADLQSVILEPNGKISCLPLAAKRPVCPADMGLSPEQEKMTVHVIMDGVVLKGNLKYTGNNEEWLYQKLEQQHVKLEDVFFATCDSNNQLSVYERVNGDLKRDIFL